MELIYYRANRERLSKYQIATSVFIINGICKVKKSALVPEAVAHIKAIYDNYALLSKSSKINYVNTELVDNQIYTDFVKGKTYDEILIELIRVGDKKAIFTIINKYAALIMMDSHHVTNYVSCQKFKEIFGITLSLDNVRCNRVANIDISLENIFISDIVIDCEWVFDFVIPSDYILYRNIRRFFYKNADRIGDLISLREILDLLGISEESTGKYACMENCFQSYVFGCDKPNKISALHRKRAIFVDYNHEINTKSVSSANLTTIMGSNICIDSQSKKNIVQRITNYTIKFIAKMR